MKRTLDIVGSLAGLILSFPILVVAGLLIRLEDGGPVFFIQPRVGRNGQIFCMIKLRTMNAGAEDDLEKLLPLNILKGPAYKIPNDPRITRVGRFLRRWSIDELPQFVNILRGEMSLVGPRPEQIWVVAQYSHEQRRRLAVKPGLTGPMQVNGRGLLESDERARFELDYVEHYSIMRDLVILYKTIPVVISGKGAL